MTHTPTGKRTTRRNAYGKLIAYIGGKRVDEIAGCGLDEFSPAESRAEAAFLSGRDDWRDAAWEGGAA